MRLLLVASTLIAAAVSAAVLAQNGRFVLAISCVPLGAVMLWATRAIPDRRLVPGLLAMVVLAVILAGCSPYAFPETALAGLVGSSLVMSALAAQRWEAHLVVPLIGIVVVGVLAPTLAGVALLTVSVSVAILHWAGRDKTHVQKEGTGT